MVTGAVIMGLDGECYPGNPLSPEQLNKVISSPRWIVASEPNGKSYVILECQEQGKVIIRRVGTARGSRRLGLASSLIEPLKVYECETWVREDNLSGLKFLRSQGFKAVGMEKGGVKLVRGKLT